MQNQHLRLMHKTMNTKLEEMNKKIDDRLALIEKESKSNESKSQS